MKSEIATLHANNTWFLVLFEPSMNVIGCRWLYKIKRRADSVFYRYKAILVARGFTQLEVLTTPKPSVLLLNQLLFGSFLPLLYLTNGRFISFMYIMHSSMVPFKRLFICNNRRVLSTLLCPVKYIAFTSPSIV
jgi:hypothetical protein